MDSKPVPATSMGVTLESLVFCLGSLVYPKDMLSQCQTGGAVNEEGAKCAQDDT